MRHISLFTLTAALLATSATVCAETAPANAIPAKVSANILKRHPDAVEMQSSQESHFGVKLLQVSFKKGNGEVEQELFTSNGHLFTNEILIEVKNDLPVAILDVVKQAFSLYDFKKAEMISNPNGVGIEYEIYLTADSVNWKLSINSKGEIAEKQRL